MPVTATWTVALAVLLSLAVGCQGDTQPDARSAPALWEQGLALEREGRHGEALRSFRQALDAGPYDEGMAYAFGERFVRQVPLDQAEAYYRERIEDDPKPQTSHYFWALALARAVELDAATEQLSRALEIDPAHEMSHAALGELCRQQGDLEGAIQHHLDAVAAHPEHRPSHEQLGTLYSWVGDTARAMQHRRLAAASDPQTPRRFFYWGRALWRAGRPQQALAELARSLELLPDDAETLALMDEIKQQVTGGEADGVD